MNLFYILIGFFLVVFGVGILYDPIFHDTKHGFIHDFTEIKWPFGAFLTLIGLGLLYVSLKKQFSKNKAVRPSSDYLMCYSCRHPFEKTSVTENHCPFCGTDLEELDGFYDRHPELKEE